MTKLKAKSQKSIIGKFTVNGTATSKPIGGHDCTIYCLTGNLWINALETATAANGLKIPIGGSITLSVGDNVSCISDVTGADVQIIIFNE